MRTTTDPDVLKVRVPLHAGVLVTLKHTLLLVGVGPRHSKVPDAHAVTSAQTRSCSNDGGDASYVPSGQGTVLVHVRSEYGVSGARINCPTPHSVALLHTLSDVDVALTDTHCVAVHVVSNAQLDSPVDVPLSMAYSTPGLHPRRGTQTPLTLYDAAEQSERTPCGMHANSATSATSATDNIPVRCVSGCYVLRPARAYRTCCLRAVPRCARRVR
jgi:hypothetical protein